jgi:transketolase
MIGCEGYVGHLGGSCSCADIVATLYLYKMKHEPQNPKWAGRDKFLMSKGHSCLAQYAVMAELGYFSKEHFPTLKSLGSMLQGHPDINKTPGIEANTGSLGQGLSIANGMAMAMRLDGKDGKVYCIIGDGELYEGQIWEAAMAAAYYKLDNVVAIVDQNGFSATGSIKERFDTNPLPEKWESFGWHVIKIDGHNIEEIIEALDKADQVKGKPTVIIARTVKGKGIPFAENVAGFHNGALTKEQYMTALNEMDKIITRCN